MTENIAILIDAENIDPSFASQIFSEIVFHLFLLLLSIKLPTRHIRGGK